MEKQAQGSKRACRDAEGPISFTHNVFRDKAQESADESQSSSSSGRGRACDDGEIDLDNIDDMEIPDAGEHDQHQPKVFNPHQRQGFEQPAEYQPRQAQAQVPSREEPKTRSAAEKQSSMRKTALVGQKRVRRALQDDESSYQGTESDVESSGDKSSDSSLAQEYVSTNKQTPKLSQVPFAGTQDSESEDDQQQTANYIQMIAGDFESAKRSTRKVIDQSNKRNLKKNASQAHSDLIPAVVDERSGVVGFDTHQPRTILRTKGLPTPQQKPADKVQVDQIQCYIRWWPTANEPGTFPPDTWVDYCEVRQRAPQLLCEYYTKRIVLP